MKIHSSKVFDRAIDGPGAGWRVEKVVSHHKDAIAGVHREAKVQAAKARAQLASHRDTGNSRIDLEFSSNNADIILNDLQRRKGRHLGAAALEYGHRDPRTGRWVDGVHALGAIDGIDTKGKG